jgi:hypothetical protein
MTGSGEAAPFRIGHPAPGRHRVGAFRLAFTFSLAPLLWSVQIAAISSIAGLACLDPARGATIRSPLGWAEPAIIAINVGALVLALGGIALSAVNLRQTWRAAPAPRGGVLSAGEGRAHWMAIGGFFAALLFTAAIAFNTVSVFWQGLCPL